MDSNHRPHAYQACALTGWAISPFYRYNLRWWRWGESNSWPPACKAGALPAELHPHSTQVISIKFSRIHWILKTKQHNDFKAFELFFFQTFITILVICLLLIHYIFFNVLRILSKYSMVGPTRIELVTSRLSGVRSNQLSSRPMLCEVAFFSQKKLPQN